jgi:hypothetical protein
MSCGSAGAGVAGECCDEASRKHLKEASLKDLKEARVEERKDAEQGAPILTVMVAEKEGREGSLTQEDGRKQLTPEAAGEKKPLKKILKVAATHCLSRNTRTAPLKTHYCLFRNTPTASLETRVLHL